MTQDTLQNTTPRDKACRAQEGYHKGVSYLVSLFLLSLLLLLLALGDLAILPLVLLASALLFLWRSRTFSPGPNKPGLASARCAPPG